MSGSTDHEDRDVGRMLERLGERIETAVLEGIGRTASRVQERKPLAADLLESDDAYLVVFDAPGATAADVDVRFDDGAVSVRIERFRELYDGFEMKLPGRGLTLEGSVELPAGTGVDPSAAEATLTKNGTLQVEIPKTEQAGGSVAVGETEDEPVDIGGDIDDDGSADSEGHAVEEDEGHTAEEEAHAVEEEAAADEDEDEDEDARK